MMLKNLSYKLTTLLVLSPVSLADASRPWQMTLQDPATPIMEGIVNFHNHIMFFITVIVVFVSWLMARCVYLFEETQNTKAEKWTHSTVLGNCMDANTCFSFNGNRSTFFCTTLLYG